jgi:hypothetical protein
MADNDSNTIKPVESLQNIPVFSRLTRKIRNIPNRNKTAWSTSWTWTTNSPKTKMTGPPLAESIIARDSITFFLQEPMKGWDSKCQRQQGTF